MWPKKRFHCIEEKNQHDWNEHFEMADKRNHRNIQNCRLLKSLRRQRQNQSVEKPQNRYAAEGTLMNATSPGLQSRWIMTRFYKCSNMLLGSQQYFSGRVFFFFFSLLRNCAHFVLPFTIITTTHKICQVFFLRLVAFVFIRTTIVWITSNVSWNIVGNNLKWD